MGANAIANWTIGGQSMKDEQRGSWLRHRFGYPLRPPFEVGLVGLDVDPPAAKIARSYAAPA